MIDRVTLFLKSAVRLVLGKLGYGLVRLSKDRLVVRTVSDFSTSPVELYVRKHYEMLRTGHFDCLYPAWRVQRIRKVIDL